MKTNLDHRRDQAGWAKSLRERNENERRQRALDDLRSRRKAFVLAGRKRKAAEGCERSQAWVKKYNEVRAYVNALCGGAGRKHASPDGWNESEGRYVR